jgi:hypothetical protein
MNTTDTTSRLKYSKRLAAVGAVSAAAMALSSASAAVSVVNVDLFQTYGGGFFSFSPLGSDFVASYNTSYMSGMRNCGFNLLNFNTSNFQWAAAFLPQGSVVDGSLSYSGNASVFLDYPSNGQVVYAGYRVVNQGPGNDQTHYGYVQATGNPAQNFTINFYAYETSPSMGIAIVPEPSSLLLGAAGVGVVAMRRRRSSGRGR